MGKRRAEPDVRGGVGGAGRARRGGVKLTPEGLAGKGGVHPTYLSDIERGGRDVTRARREELNLTQEDLADKAGIHRTYLSDIERGTRNVSLVNIERLAAALAVTMSELFAAVEG